MRSIQKIMDCHTTSLFFASFDVQVFKRPSSKAAAEKKPETYPPFHRPALSRPSPLFSTRYVEDLFEERRKLAWIVQHCLLI
jgi:hypothetical protein